MHAFTLPQRSDPWVGVRVRGRFHGGVQNVCILGNATVLDAVPLSASADLTGWYAYDQQDGVAQAGPRWLTPKIPNFTGCIIVSADLGLAGTHSESLVQDQQPLVNSESVECEFCYAHGEVETHPALERLAFNLNRHGVREDWITDDQFDPIDAALENPVDLPEHHRGPAELPLHPAAWNLLKLSVRNRKALMELYGELVYQRPLEASHLRTIGLSLLDFVKVLDFGLATFVDPQKTARVTTTGQLTGTLP